jgi:Right handed beta helix region
VNGPRKHLAIAIFVILLSSLMFSSATNVYITPNGTSQGVCTTNPQSPAWFNSPSNWGSGSGQIGPGTTVHLCGTFTDNTPGNTLLTFQGSGSSVSPITLSFDTDTTLTNTAYWGTDGAINISGRSWIVVDGANTGTIQNTGNGTAGSYPYSNPSDAIVIQNGASNVTVQNLTVANICVHTVNLNDSTGCNVGGVNDQAVTLNSVSNVTITGNTVHDSQNCIYDNMANGNSNITISNNTISHCNWGVGVGQTGTSSGLIITGNDISDAYLWDTNADSFHHNGVMVYGTGSSTVLNGLVIADNYIHGNMGANETGHIFLDPTGSPLGNMPNVLIYNNVLVSTSNGPANGYVTVGYGITGAGIYNNTIFGNGKGADGIDAVGAMVENNIVTATYTGEEVDKGHFITGSQYNVFYGLTGGTQSMCYNGTCYSSVASWNSATGFDPLPPSSIANPNLTSTYTLGSGSSAIGAGINLTSLGIAGLNIDKDGNPRPSKGAWDIGAYASQGSVPNPPTGLSAQVQ